MAQEPETTTTRAELPMRLTHLRVKNFRSIADIDIPLSPLTVLVGPNGSGKSNVVDALRFVRDVFARGLDQAVMDREGMGAIQRWGTEREGITIGVTMELPKFTSTNILEDIEYEPINNPAGIVEYDFTIFQSSEKNIVAGKESLIVSIEGGVIPEMSLVRSGSSLYGKLGDLTLYGLEQRRHPYKSLKQGSLLGPNVLFNLCTELFNLPNDEYEKFTDDEKLRDSWYSNIFIKVNDFNILFGKAWFYLLYTAELRRSIQSLNETPLDENGKNLASVLNNLSHSDDDNWHEIQFVLRQTINGFHHLEMSSVGGFLLTSLIYQNDDSESRTSYIGQESDGTVRMLGMLAALLQEPAQPFICIEEPEANIHPGALAVLAGVIDEASLRSQILVTTHSPDMLDHLPVESFLVVEKVGDTTHVGPLDASQIASVRKRLFTPGELFRMEGLQRQTKPESAS